jgi:hypothetical protein
LLGCEPCGFVTLAELAECKGGRVAPGHQAGVAPLTPLPAAAGLEQVLKCLLGLALGKAQPAARFEDERPAQLLGEPSRHVCAREGELGAFEVALFDERVEERHPPGPAFAHASRQLLRPTGSASARRRRPRRQSANERGNERCATRCAEPRRCPSLNNAEEICSTSSSRSVQKSNIITEATTTDSSRSLSAGPWRVGLRLRRASRAVVARWHRVDPLPRGVLPPRVEDQSLAAAAAASC